MITLGIIHFLFLSTANAFLFGLPFGQNFGASFHHDHDFPAVPSFHNQHFGSPFEQKIQAPFSLQFDGSLNHGFPPSFAGPTGQWDLPFASSNWPHHNEFGSINQPEQWRFMDNWNHPHQNFPKFDDNWMVPFDQPNQINQFHTLNTHHYAWDQNPLGELFETKKNKSIKHESSYNPNLHGDEKGTWKTTGNEAIAALHHKRQNFVLPEKRFRFSQPNGKVGSLQMDNIDLKFDDPSLRKGFEKNQLDESKFLGSRKMSTFKVDSDLSSSHRLPPTRPRNIFYGNKRKNKNKFGSQHHFVNLGGIKHRNPRLHNRRFLGAKEMDEYEIIEERPFYSDEFQPKINKYLYVTAPRIGKSRRARKRRYIIS